MILNGYAPDDIKDYVRARSAGADAAITRAYQSLTHGKRKQQIKDYQAFVLYYLATWYNRPGARILEIGTYYGFSAAVLAQGAPLAQITTLNPTEWEVYDARENLSSFGNVEVVNKASWDYKTLLKFNMVFVDGDHKRVTRDLPWFNRLKIGGLMLFHDYSPIGSTMHCPPVYRALEAKRAEFREFDVLVVDKEKVGMAGWFQRGGETWLMQP